MCAIDDYGKHVPAINNVNVIYVMQSCIYTWYKSSEGLLGFIETIIRYICLHSVHCTITSFQKT